MDIHFFIEIENTFKETLYNKILKNMFGESINLVFNIKKLIIP